jgi:hypothetical protein
MPSAGSSSPIAGGVLPTSAASGGATASSAGTRVAAGTGPGSSAVASSGSGGGAATTPASSAHTTATGGSSAAGTSAAPGSGGSASVTQTGGDLGEYFVSGGWHGYVWTAAVGMGSTIMPMDFKAQTTGMPRCVQGSVAGAADYSGTASLGFDIAEERGSGSMMTVTPSKAGVTIEIANHGSSELRLQVQGPGSSTPWCATLSGTGGFVPWEMFNTKCWDGSGTAYNKEPISKISVMVPGMATAAVPFDFCVNSLVEADGPAAGSAAGSGGSTPGGAGAGTAGSGSPTTGGSSTVTPIAGGCDGYATGYWDCCKPHCGWKSNVPGGSNPLAACDKADNAVGNVDDKNACEAGGTAYMCHSLVPWAVNDKLAYGYAAVAASAQKDVCGKCYQLQFLGRSFNAGEDPGSAAMAGKTMIVQAINIGSDVQNGQFDVAIPGRGVGMYDACSSQWGVARADLGETYGGFLPVCKTQHGRTDHAALKSCVMQSCMNVFTAHNLTELAAGCEFFVDWFEVADNPSVKYKEVTCPAELANKGVKRSGSPGDACLR